MALSEEDSKRVEAEAKRIAGPFKGMYDADVVKQARANLGFGPGPRAYDDTPKRVMSSKLREARDKQAEVFKEAWRLAKEGGRVRPTSEDIRDARVTVGVPAKGVWEHEEAESLVGTTTKGFRIASGTEVVRLAHGGSCAKGHYWDDGSTVYKRHNKPMCPICGSVIG